MGRALMAYRGSPDTEQALLGAMAEAQQFLHVHDLARAYLKPKR